ncbi:MAG: ATP-binding protein [Chloroflexota bacterium]
MTEAGGPTTQSGILYQNSVAALYLGRLLDASQRPDNERVSHVRVEAPEQVDDIVVKFADGHRVFIQAKENISSSSNIWRKLWSDLDKQFRDESFLRNQDRLLLHLGQLRDEHDDLREICQRATTNDTITKWHERLTQSQQALLDKIRPALAPSGLTDELLLQLFGHLDIEIAPLRNLERDYVTRWMPQTNKLPMEIFRLLRDRVGGKSRVRGEFKAHELRHSLILESSDLQFDIPSDVADLQSAILKCGSLLRQHKHTFADTDLHIDREVADQIVDWLLGEDSVDKNVAMLLDQAGMGKTVVMRSVLQKLETRGIDVLAIKADQQLSEITALPEIQHKLALPYPVEQIISRLAKLNRVVVLIDQIDALSLTLAHDQPTLNTVLDFVTRLRRIPNVRILLSCRTFDRNTDPRLKNIELDRSFPLSPLSREQVSAVCANLHIDEADLSQATRELLCIPLHLDLFARAVANESPLEQLRGIASLQELYALIWQNIVLKQEAGSPAVAERIEVLNRLTHYMNQQQRTVAPQSLLQTTDTAHLERAVNWLASVGILLRSKAEWSFLHQTFFDYCYARQFVDSGGNIVSNILTSKQGIFERPKLIQIIAYLRGSDHHRYLRDLRHLLNASDLRFHLYDVLLRWFGSLHNPTDDEWIIAHQLLNHKQERWNLLRAMYNNSAWFERLRPVLKNWLSSSDDIQVDQSLFYLASLIEIAQSDVVSILRSFLNQSEEWNQKIANILSRIRQWQSKEAVELFEETTKMLPGLNHHIFWQIDAISKAFPRNGCQILQNLFDFALVQHLEEDLKKSRTQNNKAQVPSVGLFDSLQNLESSIEKSLKEINQATPKLFVEKMLSWVIKVVKLHPEPSEHQDWFTSDALSYNWYGNTFRIQLSVIHSLIEALTKVAKTEPDYFRPLAEVLIALPYETPQQLLTYIYRALPELYSEDAFKFLITDTRRLDIGDYEQYDSRQVISAIYPYLTNEQRLLIEKQIINHTPIYKIFGLDALSRYGIEQYRLFHAIPEKYLSRNGLKRFRELQRKFPNYKISTEPITGQSGFVSSPIEEDQASKMSDRSWLRAMQKYQGATQHKDFLKGGARQLSSVLSTQIKLNPERFYHLFQRVPKDIDDAYATAYIDGIAESEAPNAWFFDAVLRFATQESRDIKRPVAWAIKKQRKINVPEEIIDLLISWVQQPIGNDEKRLETDAQHDPYHYYLNSDRGAAFGAVMRILDARNSEEAKEQKWRLIEFVALDASTALRLGAIHELTYMIQYDRSRSWSLFKQLILDHEVLLETHYVREFLYWSFYKNFLQVSPYINMMMDHTNEEVQGRGAGLACVASISDGAMESDEALATAQALAEKTINGAPAWRRGAAQIYTYNMTHSSSAETRHLCKAKVCQLIDDEDKRVREKIDHKFFAMTEVHFFELRDFIEEYALAENHLIEHQFAEYLWEHGMLDPNWSLTIVQTLLDKKEQQDRWRSGMEELMRLVLRIYTSPLVDDATKDEAMDTFDLLMQKYGGTANQILSEWDRR